MSRPYAEVIGDPIAQSKSPVIHGFWIERLGLDADYRTAHVTSTQLDEYLAERRQDSDWRGCNVTMPHKQAVIDLIDRLDPLAQSIGAVNTIVREGDQLVGYNTDAPGFLEPLKSQLEKTHLYRMARILGTGGAARAIIASLAKQDFTIVLAGRDSGKARAMLDELAHDGEHHAIALTHFANETKFPFDDREGCLDLVINASPLGMAGQPPLLFDWSHAPPGAIAYDIVTNPVETEFLKNAQAAGHATLDGLNMLIGQAAIAFALFFGRSAPRDCDAELRGVLTR
ncbi:MAG: shikimate dehydrogenase [Sphingomonadales bacterium]|nr:MAG: shikimate dehydrogenase [Sphingomonadales bacterium]